MACRPPSSQDALDPVEDLLVGVVLVGRCRELLASRDEHLEHGRAAARIVAREQKPDTIGPILIVSPTD